MNKKVEIIISIPYLKDKGYSTYRNGKSNLQFIVTKSKCKKEMKGRKKLTELNL